jgi:hypothetical protein
MLDDGKNYKVIACEAFEENLKLILMDDESLPEIRRKGTVC